MLLWYQIHLAGAVTNWPAAINNIVVCKVIGQVYNGGWPLISKLTGRNQLALPCFLSRIWLSVTMVVKDGPAPPGLLRLINHCILPRFSFSSDGTRCAKLFNAKFLTMQTLFLHFNIIHLTQKKLNMEFSRDLL